MNRAIEVLRSVARTTFASLPPDARKTLSGVKVQLADLGHTDAGQKIRGAARNDGRMVLLDTSTVLENADNETPLEELLAHELAHCVRALLGVSHEDERREEVETNRQVKRWGFRPGKTVIK